MLDALQKGIPQIQEDKDPAHTTVQDHQWFGELKQGWAVETPHAVNMPKSGQYWSIRIWVVDWNF